MTAVLNLKSICVFIIDHQFPLPLWERIKVRGTTVAVETAPHPNLLPPGEKE
jgi:hypothetical protein